MPELSGGIEARQGAACGHRGHRDRDLDAPEGLERLTPRLDAPGCPLGSACVFKTLPACGLCGDSLDVFLKDNLLRGCGTHHLTEPAQVGGTPVSSTCRAEIVPQPKSFEPQLGRLQLPQGLFPRPAQGADGCIVDGGAIHRGEVP